MTEIYHITSIKNLPNIIHDGKLLCDTIMNQNNTLHVNIAHNHIKYRRTNRDVPVGKGGKLADYVPFYFAPRSPMLCAIHHGNVEGYTEGQKTIIHLVTNIEKIIDLCLDWCFTDRHAVLAVANFYNNINYLNQVDWKVMKSDYWNNIPSDLDRKERRQAEFLVYHAVPWSCIWKIGVCDVKIAQEVKEIITPFEFQPEIIVVPEWYYPK